MQLPKEAKRLLEQEIKMLLNLHKTIKHYMLGALAGGALQIMRVKKELEEMLFHEILLGKTATRRARIEELQALVNKIISVPEHTDKDVLSSSLAATSFSNVWATAQMTGTPFDWDARIRRIVATENSRSYSDVTGAVAEDLHMSRKWVSILDAKVCKTCAAMDGEETQPGETFKNGYEPGYVHPNCRCYSILVIK